MLRWVAWEFVSGVGRCYESANQRPPITTPCPTLQLPAAHEAVSVPEATINHLAAAQQPLINHGQNFHDSARFQWILESSPIVQSQITWQFSRPLIRRRGRNSVLFLFPAGNFLIGVAGDDLTWSKRCQFPSINTSLPSPNFFLFSSSFPHLFAKILKLSLNRTTS